jgi:hypothetical protein
VPVHAEYARGGGDVAAVFAKHFLEKTIGWNVRGGNRAQEKVQIQFLCEPFAGLRQIAARQRVAFCSSDCPSSIAPSDLKSW